MKIDGVRIYDEGPSGLSNQLIALIIRIQQARRNGTDLLVLDDFLMGLDTRGTCAVEKIFCMASLNEAAFPVVVSGKQTIQLVVDKVEYGAGDTNIDLTSHFRMNPHKFTVPTTLNLNELEGDPCKNEEKHLTITYCVDSHYSITKCYKENSHFLLCPVNIDVDAIPYTLGIGWMHSEGDQDEFNTILRKIRFHPSFYKEHPTMTIGSLSSSPGRTHILHLRVEPDAIAHWSFYNRMSEPIFEKALHTKYIEILHTHLLHESVRQEGDRVLVLSYSESNPVLDVLKEKNYPYQFIQKNRHQGREWNAIVDLTTAQTRGNGILIGNFNLSLLRGSTFSYMLLHTIMKKVEKCVLIDLDQLSNEPSVI